MGSNTSNALAAHGAADAAKAYPRPAVRYDGPINDVLGGRPVVVGLARDDALVAYDPRVDGDTLTFSDGPDGELAAGGSHWASLSGAVLDGPDRGPTLRSATEIGQLYWAAWLQFHPDTTVYGRDWRGRSTNCGTSDPDHPRVAPWLRIHTGRSVTVSRPGVRSPLSISHFTPQSL
jgi:hypothetical protein